MSFTPGIGLRVDSAQLRRALGSKFGAFMAMYTFSYQPSIGMPKTISAVREDDREFLLPRVLEAWVAQHFGLLHDYVMPLRMRFEPLLRPYQDAGAKRICAQLRECGRAFISMRAGTGKTFLAAGVVGHLQTRVIYVVPGAALVKQVKIDLQNVLTGANIVAYNKIKPNYDRAKIDVIVITIHSACSAPNELFSGAGLAILDECDRYCTRKRCAIFHRAPWMVLGMTATPQRADNFHHIARCGLGDVAAIDCPDDSFAGTALYVHYRAAREYSQNLIHSSTGKVFTHYMHEQSISDPVRMTLARDYLAALYRANRNIFVFAEEVSHLVAFRDICASIDVTGELLVGGQTEREIERRVSSARILFTTYGYSGVGLSIPRMDSILFLTPRKANMIQICGRIQRGSPEGARRRIIIDIVDVATCMRQQFQWRKSAYEFYKFAIQPASPGHPHIYE